MNDSVSNWIDLLILGALTTVIGGILLPVFPLTSVAFIGTAALMVAWMRRRTVHRSTTQVIWDVEAEASALRGQRTASPQIERF